MVAGLLGPLVSGPAIPPWSSTERGVHQASVRRSNLMIFDEPRLGLAGTVRTHSDRQATRIFGEGPAAAARSEARECMGFVWLSFCVAGNREDGRDQPVGAVSAGVIGDARIESSRSGRLSDSPWRSRARPSAHPRTVAPGRVGVGGRRCDSPRVRTFDPAEGPCRRHRRHPAHPGHLAGNRTLPRRRSEESGLSMAPQPPRPSHPPPGAR